MKITNTIKREFLINPTTGKTETVYAEISDTENSFSFRLRINNYSTNWTTYYNGILTLRSKENDILYGFATGYWDGSLPIEEPFMIKQGNVL
jgi:hypothetical protein